MVYTETRKLAAIMFTDIVGFSRQMGTDEARMLRLLAVHNPRIQQAVAVHHGHVIKSTGDGFLVEFSSVVNAVQCAQHLQAGFRAYNAGKEAVEQIHIRIGIHLGDIVQHEGDVQGDGVNIAARLQPLAQPDTICISQKVYEEVNKKLHLGTVVPLGQPKLKNIAERFPIYVLLPHEPQGFRQALRVHWLKLTLKKRTFQGVAAALLLLLGSAGTLAVRHLYFSTSSGLDLPTKPSLVVLPFDNMSKDPEQDYFSDGITEDLTTDLSRLSSLFVVARNSAFTYKGKPVHVQEIGKDLGVQYVLEGSVRKADDQVRITAQLVDATTGHHLWAERYDRPLQDIFALQTEIVQRIVITLQLQLTLQEQGYAVRKRTETPPAYDALLRGIAYTLRTTKEANAQARQQYEQAVVLDPQYADAYAALAWTYYIEWASLWTQDPQSLRRAGELAQQALALDDSEPFSHMVLGHVALSHKQYDQAIAEAEQAIALNPNWADGYVTLAFFLRLTGREKEAVPLVEQAMRLNPHYPPAYLSTLGTTYCGAGRYMEAVSAHQRALTRNPNLLLSRLCLAACYSMAGREEEARAQVTEIRRLSPQLTLEASMGAVPFKDPAANKPMFEALRKAGLK